MILPLGVPESVVVTGAERTTAWPAVKAAAEKHGLEIEADQRAHLGIFYRSDHFSMARAGVPAFSVAAGHEDQGQAGGLRPARRCRSSTTRRTTRRRTRCGPTGTSRASSVLARFALDVARDVANADRLPTWNPGDEFRPAREKSGVK